MNDDSSLLRRYAEDREDEAFTELVRRHLDFVFSAALREVRGDFARAQDITQVVFTALARKASTLHQRDTLVGWFHVSVHHAAAELMRSEQRRQKREQEASAMLEQSTPATAEDDWEQLKPVLNAAVQELGEVDRDAVLLRFYQKRPLREIGTILRLSEDAAQKRVERALEKMRAGLVRRGITSTSVALAMMLQNHAVVAAPAGLLGTITHGALASASAGSGATALFQFIGMGKIPLGIATVLVIAGGTAFVLHQRPSSSLDQEIPALPSGDRPMAALRPKNNQPKSNAAPAIPAGNDRLKSEPVALATASTQTAPQDPGGGQGFTPNQMKQWLAAANDPRVLARLAADGRAQTRQRYSYFIDQLNYTAEQTETLLRLLDDKREAPMDLAVANLLQGIDPRENLNGFQSRVAAEKAAIEKKIRAFLGDDFYREYQAYNQQLNQEAVFDRLERLVGGTDNVLTPEQATKLQQLLLVHRRTSPELLSEARGFLSPGQIDALEQVFRIKEAVKNRVQQNLPPSDP